MRGLAAALAALVLLLPGAAAAELSCEAAAQAAEREGGIPAGLLTAIGQVESGRLDRSGARVVWPWTVNIRGQGVFFRTKADAVNFAAAALDAGFRSIDAGCFQVNLQWHPDAFGTVGEAFDPMANARYAARFLASLVGPDGDWAAAVGRYHSAAAVFGEPYRALVMSRWSGAPVADRTVVRMSARAQAVHVWYGAGSMPVIRR